MTTQEACEAFANNRSGTANSVYSHGNAIFSYGSHFPMAVRTSKGIVFNKDKYSMTTSKHQGILRRALAEAGLTIVEEVTTQEIRALV